MKKAFLFIVMFLCSTSFAHANDVCSGGFDGKPDSKLTACSELGGLGNLVYEKDASGKVIRKRSDQEIKSYLTNVVESRMKKRGVTMKSANGSPVIKINEKNVAFDVFNQNGDKIYTYVVDKENGVPLNEKSVRDARNNVNEGRKRQRQSKADRLKRLETLGEKIKEEELNKNLAVKK